MSKVRVEVTIRVVPMDTSVPITVSQDAVLFDDENVTRTTTDVVARTAAIVYQRASGQRLATPAREGGR